MVETGNGYEICFGISHHGEYQYHISYDITDIVKILDDTNMLYWRFINDQLSNPPEQAKIRITLDDMELSQDNSRIWGFGTEGEIQFDDGNVVFTSSESLSQRNYMTALVTFDNMEFSGGERISLPLQHYIDMAFEGSSYSSEEFKQGNSKDYSTGFSLVNKITAVVYGLFFLTTFGVIIFTIVALINKRKVKSKYKRGDLKGEYYREPPEGENWSKLSLPLNSTKLGDEQNIIRAFILDWINKGYLVPETYEKGFIFKKDVPALKIMVDEIKGSEVEKSFFKMFKEAAVDNLLQANEFNRFFSKSSNQRAYKTLLESIKSNSEEFLFANGYTTKVKKRYFYTDKGDQLTEDLVKFYNYLDDFTLLDERELREIVIWDKLLIYATLFGISRKIYLQLKDLDPSILIHGMYYSNYYGDNIRNSYSNQTSSSSGGGGSTSFGGGGGSFGGGSGGGVR